jgi:hypothetical protein
LYAELAQSNIAQAFIVALLFCIYGRLVSGSRAEYKKISNNLLLPPGLNQENWASIDGAGRSGTFANRT